MKRPILAAILFLLPLGACAPAVDTIKPADLKPGMTGVMRTVMKGTKIEEIPVEVVDVIWKAAPGRDIVLIRLLGDEIARSGVAQGMSGSPVYIDGKLLGALAYAWSFSREPYAGVTPIESMTRVKLEDGAKAASAWTWEPGSTIGDPAIVARFTRPLPMPASTSPANMTTLRTPIAVSGFADVSRAMLADSLMAFDVTVVQGGGAGEPLDVPKDLKLEPGGLLCVELIRGDIHAAAVGTVTEVAGDRVWGFGHPMYGSGNVEYPMATGYVHLTLPREEISFKIGTSVKTVGTLRLDHSAGIMGIVGKTPEMVRLAVNVKRRDVEGDAKFNYEVVKDRRLMLSLVNAAVVNSMTVSGKPENESKVLVKTAIDIAGREPIVIENVFGGPQASADAVSSYVAPLGYVVNNPFEEVDVRSVTVDFEIVEGDPRAFLRSVETDKDRYRPGETVRLRATLRPYRGEDFVKHIEIPIPADAGPGQRVISLGDANSDARAEAVDMPHRARPESLKQLIDFFRRTRPNTELYIRLSEEGDGVALSGRELPDLPASVASVLTTRPRPEASPFRLSETKSVSTDHVIVGSERLQIEIVKE